MHVQFQLDGMTPQELEAFAEQVAPSVAAFPGLVEKVFLADEETNSYAGAYVWADQESLDAYRASELFTGPQENPAIVNYSAHVYTVLEQPTRVTSRLRGSLPLSKRLPWN